MARTERLYSENAALTIGFIGLGAMGSHMVRHLCSAGHRVHVVDSDPAAVARAVGHGAAAASSPQALGDIADIILLCLPTPAIVRSVVLGDDGVARGSRVGTVVDHSTSGPTLAQELATELGRLGIASLDAPLAGATIGAEAGTLTVMASGDAATFRRLEPYLQAFGRTIVHVGDRPGQGQILKLINNIILAANIVTATEGMILGARFGLPPQIMTEVLNAGSARSFVTEAVMADRVIEGDFKIGFRLELMRKDMRLGLAEAEAAGAPMWMGAITKHILDLAQSQTAGDVDLLEVIRYLQVQSAVSLLKV